MQKLHFGSAAWNTLSNINNGTAFIDIANAALASLNTAVTAQDGLMATVGQKISDFGAMGKVMGAGGKALGTAGFVMSVASGYNLIKNGNARGWLDIGMATSSVAATALMTAGLISNPVGWTIIGVTAIYGLSTAIYDLSTSSK